MSNLDYDDDYDCPECQDMGCEYCDDTDECNGLGDCYVVHGRYIMKQGFDDSPFGYILVHGYVTGTGGDIKGIEHDHCWLECPQHGTVLDIANGRRLSMKAEIYYAIGQVNQQKTKRYKPSEVRKMILKHEHWGPWE